MPQQELLPFSRLVVCSLLAMACEEPPPQSSAERNCTTAWKAIDQWRLAQAGYDTLLWQALAEGWSGEDLDRAVAEWVAERYAQSGGQTVKAAPSTNMCTCTPSEVEEFCAEMRAQHRPQIICDAARVHEDIHVGQCQANRALPAGDPNKYPCVDDVADIPLDQRVAFEHEAYDGTFAVLRPWLAANCASRCEAFVNAVAWKGAITLDYRRTSQSAFGNSELQGKASYTSQLDRPLGSVSVDGYTETWIGPARGTADFEYVVRDPMTGMISYELRGNGALVDEPPLGQFNAEVFRIDPELCFYELETSAVIRATDRDGTRPDGLMLVVGGNPIDLEADVITGSRALTLPVPLFGGIQETTLRLPGLSFEIGQTTFSSGTFEVHWTFTPDDE